MLQALLGVRPAEQIKAQSRTPQQKSHAEAQQDTETVPDPEDKMVRLPCHLQVQKTPTVKHNVMN